MWKCDISDNTRETVWKYLQLILFSVIGSVHNSAELGDTAKLFEAINEDELKDKLAETMENMQSMFDNFTKKNGNGEGEGEGDKPGEKGKDGQEPKDKGDQGDKEGKTPEGEKPDPNNTHGKDKRPEETKEQHAMRKLNENADLQRGVVAEGTYQYRRPEKDW